MRCHLPLEEDGADVPASSLRWVAWLLICVWVEPTKPSNGRHARVKALVARTSRPLGREMCVTHEPRSRRSVLTVREPRPRRGAPIRSHGAA